MTCTYINTLLHEHWGGAKRGQRRRKIVMFVIMNFLPLRRIPNDMYPICPVFVWSLPPPGIERNRTAGICTICNIEVRLKYTTTHGPENSYVCTYVVVFLVHMRIRLFSSLLRADRPLLIVTPSFLPSSPFTFVLLSFFLSLSLCLYLCARNWGKVPHGMQLARYFEHEERALSTHRHIEPRIYANLSNAHLATFFILHIACFSPQSQHA